MKTHVADWREYLEEGPPRKVARITCSCGTVIVHNTEICHEWQLHVLGHQISELEGEIAAIKVALMPPP